MSQTQGKYGSSAVALTTTGFNSLAGGSFATSDEINVIGWSGGPPLDILVEVSVADIVEAGNKQVVVYAISSVDGTNFSDNQSATNESAYAYVGVVPMNGTGTWRSKAMSLAAAFGGTLPPKCKLVLKNDNSTTALAGSGNTVQLRAVYAESV